MDRSQITTYPNGATCCLSGSPTLLDTAIRGSKSPRSFTLKAAGDDAKEGDVEAVFSVFNEIDSDGDVVLAKAFTDGQEVAMAWHHQWPEIIGKGVVRVETDRAVFDGKFFLDTDAGRNAYNTVKAMGSLQEWSFGYEVTEIEDIEIDGMKARGFAAMNLFEVSPVLKGANSNTSTLSVKSDKGSEGSGAIKAHRTETTEAPFAAGDLKSEGEHEAYYTQMYAWKDPEGDPTIKSTYRFPHHMVTPDGSIHEASVRACVGGIAVLNGGAGGSSIPQKDRQGVYDHLAAHLKDAGVEAPALKERANRLSDDLIGLLESGKSAGIRVQEIANLRAEDGRSLGQETKSRLEMVKEGLHEVIAAIDEALAEPVSTDDLQSLRARSIMTLSRVGR